VRRLKNGATRYAKLAGAEVGHSLRQSARLEDGDHRLRDHGRDDGRTHVHVDREIPQRKPQGVRGRGEGFDESFAWINADKRRAARLHIEMTKEKRLSEDDLFALFNTKDMEYTKTPHNVAKMVDFLHSIGSVKTKPASWRDLFSPRRMICPV
jgi:hypothetical protein